MLNVVFYKKNSKNGYSPTGEAYVSTMRSGRCLMNSYMQYDVNDPIIDTEFSIDENFDGAKMLTTEQMFLGQDNLISVNTQFSKSKSSKNMFNGCSKLKSVISDFSSVTDTTGMFWGCGELEIFEASLASVKDAGGAYPFGDCRKLTRCITDLSSLEDGRTILSNSNGDIINFLDIDSLRSIVNTIKDYSNTPQANDAYRNFRFGIPISKTTWDSEKNTIGTSSYQYNKLAEKLNEKGWTLAATFKPEETAAISSDECICMLSEESGDYANYVGEDGKYYNIHTCDVVIGNSNDWITFDSKEEAESYWKLTRIQK